MMLRGLECEVQLAAVGGGRARGVLARSAAAADAALEELGSGGAAEDGALDVDARGGKAARSVGSLLGSGRGIATVREGEDSRHRGGMRTQGALARRAATADAEIADGNCGDAGERPRARRRRDRRRSCDLSTRSWV